MFQLGDMQATFTSVAVANRFIKLAEESGERLTLMKLLKLVYFAHGWHLALSGVPLLKEQVEAWKFGPVAPSVYHGFKRFASSPITELGSEFDEAAFRATGEILVSTPVAAGSSAFEAFIRKIWEVYGKLSAFQLSDLTHQPGSPWFKVWFEKGGRERKGTDIPDEMIRDYFKAKVAA